MNMGDKVNTVVSSELQSVLNHICGQMPPTPLDGTLSKDVSEEYIRGTWFNNSFYLQDKDGVWHLKYINVDQR